jgi:uncharacterized membrane protein YidH (DUF202 family)
LSKLSILFYDITTYGKILVRCSKNNNNSDGGKMVNYLWNLELFYYIILLIIIVSGFIDWYRMDRLIDNDLKVQYLTAVWSKISIGLFLALYFFIYF